MGPSLSMVHPFGQRPETASGVCIGLHMHRSCCRYGCCCHHSCGWRVRAPACWAAAQRPAAGSKRHSWCFCITCGQCHHQRGASTQDKLCM